MDSFEDEELLKLVELEEETNNEAENLITEDELLQIDDRLFPNQNSETFITEEEFLEKQSLDISDVTPSSEPKEEFSFNLDDSSQIFKPVCLKAGDILPKYMLPKDEDMDTDPLDITDDGIDDVTKNMTDSNEEASIHDSSLDTDPDLTNVQDNDGEVCSGGDDLTKDDDAGSNDSRNNHGTSLNNASVHKEHALGESLTKWKGHVQKGEEMIENEENRGKENEDIDAKSNYSGRNQGTSLDNASVEEHVLEEPITKRRKDAHNEKEMMSLDISDVTPSSEPKEEFSFNLDDSSDFNQIRNNPFALLLTGNIIWDTNGSSGSFSSSCIAQM
jgi:hypothetical protein